MAIQELNDANFDNETSSGLVMVDFWAPWCAPCRMIAPILDELSDDYSEVVKIAKVNVDENPQTAQKFSVTSIPTVVILKNGEIIDRAVGALPKPQYADLIQKHSS